MINKLPLIGWFFSLVANVSLSVPFWLFWTVFGLGRHYFYFVPATYFDIPFWHCVGLFLILGIFKGMLPELVHVTQTNSSGDKVTKESEKKTLKAA